MAGHVLMFSGKGGVGKTTCAAAAALHFATQGSRTLAISTDATPSLSHIYETSGNGRLTRVADNLYFQELGLEQVREMWDNKFGREVYDVFSAFVDIEYTNFVGFMTSVLPGLSDEMMVEYIRELVERGDYDTIVWDTAPLGQTLALLQTPTLLADHLRLAPRIYSRLRIASRKRGPVLDILRRWGKLSEQNMDFLRSEVRFALVTIPEALAVQQLDHILGELSKYGIAARDMVVNHVVKQEDSPYLRTRKAQQRVYLDIIHAKYGDKRIVELPAFAKEVKGLDSLREVARLLWKEGFPGTYAQSASPM